MPFPSWEGLGVGTAIGEKPIGIDLSDRRSERSEAIAPHHKWVVGCRAYIKEENATLASPQHI